MSITWLDKERGGVEWGLYSVIVKLEGLQENKGCDAGVEGGKKCEFGNEGG